MKRLFFVLVLTGVCLFSRAQSVNVFFNSGSSVMRTNDVFKLNDLSRSIKKSPVPLTLTAYSDTVGDKKRNMALCERRIKEVKYYLLRSGVKEKDISTLVVGESYVDGRDNQYNRRVEITAKKNATAVKNFNEYLNLIRPKPQKFLLAADAPFELEGEKGTIITVKANSFVTMDNKPVTGKISVELTEYYSLADFASDKLSTVSNGNVIISSGMVNVVVKSGSAELKLKDKTDILISFPKSDQEGYGTFYGKRDMNGIMNWSVDERERAKAAKGANDIGFSLFGDKIVIMDKDSADKRNAQIQFDNKSGGFKILTEAEKKERAAFWADLAQKEKDRIDSMKAAQMKMENDRKYLYNAISSSKLGFINCDRFNKKENAINTTYVFSVEAADSTEFCYLFFKNTNSILPLYKSNGVYGQNLWVPKNVPVRLLAVSTLQNGKANYIYDEFESRDKVEKKLEYDRSKTASFEEIIKLLKN